MIQINQAVKITWLDAQNDTGDWQNNEDLGLGLASCINIGIVSEVTPLYITLVGAKTEDQSCQQFTIPVSGITKIERLSVCSEIMLNTLSICSVE